MVAVQFQVDRYITQEKKHFKVVFLHNFTFRNGPLTAAEMWRQATGMRTTS